MTKTLTTMIMIAGLMAGAAHAREPGAPTLTPVGATVGIPIGAAPPAGLHFTINATEQNGSVVGANGQKLPVTVDVAFSALTLQYATDTRILGGRYSALAIVPLVHVKSTTPGGSTTASGVGDMTLVPISLSWMLSPGVFVSAGLDLGLPTGSFDASGAKPNIGSHTFSTGIGLGYSYLRGGWNLSALATYYTYQKNSATNYKSGDEIQLDWTAMKNLGGFSAGLVGYGLWQMTKDVNSGSSYGGSANGKAVEVGLGLGVNAKLGKGMLSAQIMRDVHARNAVKEAGVFKISYAIPLGH